MKVELRRYPTYINVKCEKVPNIHTTVWALVLGISRVHDHVLRQLVGKLEAAQTELALMLPFITVYLFVLVYWNYNKFIYKVLTPKDSFYFVFIFVSLITKTR